jgi:UDP-2,3-diacylglucosamine pyrophosphatase LpxH
LLKDNSYERYILVGDIIDGWLFTKYKKFSYEHTRVIRRLLKLSKDKEIIWISGNHDEFLRKYTPIELGNIKVVDEYTENGIWFCHGDKYDGIIKMHWLGMLGSVGYDLAIVIDRFLKKFNKNTSLSKFLKDNVKAAVSFMVDFENEMVRQAKKRNCHTVVCGHIHTPADKELDGVRYLNCGDFVENCSYIIYSNNKLSLCTNF